ncbi:MAG: helical backbone metal receptor [Candidatus Sumerlaeia bacterium]|nr:helical backbone metal receptor [Candidatus Sumerlaeia bacterium]
MTPPIRRAAAAALLLLALLTAPLRAEDARTSDTLRIVSLAPNLTEALFEIGAGPQLVGVTDYCRWPEEAARLPRLGGHLNPAFERMVALRPDLAVGVPSGRDLETRLGAAGVPTLAIESLTLEDIREGLAELGRRLGREREAEAAIARFDAALDKLRAPRAGDAPRVLLVLGRPPGAVRDVFSVGPGTFLHEVIETLGHRNYLDGAPALYPTVSKESLVIDPPEFVIELREGIEALDGAEREELRRDWAKALGPRAKGRTRVQFIDDAHLSIPGPGVVSSMERLRALLARDDGFATAER